MPKEIVTTDEAMNAAIEKAATEKYDKMVKEKFNQAGNESSPVVQVKAKTIKEIKNPVGLMFKALALANPNMGNLTLEKALEAEGYEANMFFSEKFRNEFNNNKSLTMQVGSQGGYFVHEDFAAEFIPMLLSQAVVRKSGVNVVPMPMDNLTYTTRTGQATFTWTDEKPNVKESVPAYSRFRLSGKKGAMQCAVSNDLLLYSNINASAQIEKDIVQDASLGIDLVELVTGTGSQYMPKSIINLAASANKVAQSGTTATLIGTSLVNAKKRLLKANVPMINPVWYIDPGDVCAIMYQTNAQDFPMFYANELQMKGTLLGYPVFQTTQLRATGGATSQIVLADANQIIIGESQSIKIEFFYKGQYLNADNTLIAGQVTDESVFSIQVKEDVAVKHDTAISVITGVTWGV